MVLPDSENQVVSGSSNSLWLRSLLIATLDNLIIQTCLAGSSNCMLTSHEYKIVVEKTTIVNHPVEFIPLLDA
mgnify:CR=1 FL=1